MAKVMTELDKLQQVIKQVSTSARKLLNSELTERAIVLLIQDSIPQGGYRSSKPTKKLIGQILQAAAKLDVRYLKLPEDPE